MENIYTVVAGLVFVGVGVALAAATYNITTGEKRPLRKRWKSLLLDLLPF